MAQPIYLLFKKYSIEVKRWLNAIFHIPRLDSTRASVKIVYATPERAIAKYVVPLRNKQTDIPIIGFYLASQVYNPEKNTVVENLETIKYKDNNIAKRLKPLQTYSLTYVINIWTKLQMDMDIVLYQLLTQFTPYRYLAVESNIDYKNYENTTRFYPMTGGPEQGKTWDEANEKYERKPGQWFPLLIESTADASNLEPGEAGDRLIRYDINLMCDRAYLPLGGFEYKSIKELQINTVTDWYTKEGINIYAMTEADFNYLMTHDDNWLSSVTTYNDLPSTGNQTGDIRRVTEEDSIYTEGEPYIYGVADISFYKQAVNTLNDLPLTGNIDGDIRYVNNESDYYRWNTFVSEWQRYDRWIKLGHYLRDIVI